MTYATLDIDALRDHRQHDRGNNLLSHLRLGAFDYWRTTAGYTAQPQLRDAEELTVEECDEIGCREMERFWSDYYREDITVPRRRPPHWGYSRGPGPSISEEPPGEL
jgi:hypothetical protein